MQGRKYEHKPRGEEFLGEAVQRCLWSTCTGTFARGTMMAEVMTQLLVYASHQRCSASWTAAIAGKPGRHLGNVGEAPIRSLTKKQAFWRLRSALDLPPCGLSYG